MCDHWLAGWLALLSLSAAPHDIHIHNLNDRGVRWYEEMEVLLETHTTRVSPATASATSLVTPLTQTERPTKQTKQKYNKRCKSAHVPSHSSLITGAGHGKISHSRRRGYSKHFVSKQKQSRTLSLMNPEAEEGEEETMVSGWGEAEDMKEDMLKDWGEILEKWDGKQKEKARPKQLSKLCRKVSLMRGLSSLTRRDSIIGLYYTYVRTNVHL